MHKFQFEDLSGSGDNGIIRPRNRFWWKQSKFKNVKMSNEVKIDNLRSSFYIY